ncbi:hypothetical protein WA026_018326 [Henosepilachna vigintioctopunctata]|uniref:AB hydrolase-1 domain-containing protein n=1 Tax=Henosepilachna vigintioctopunctata TaxID=420089 RepID=A0AAW1VE59_9CUCU
MRKKMSWNQYSEEKLNEIEQKILSTLITPYTTFYIPVKTEFGTEEKIWTIALNTESKKTPLVMVHGFAAGIGFWCRNLDRLAKDRPVYAFDLLGFGRSSRPTFSDDGTEAEKQMVDGIEAWRAEMKLEKFYLLGHSMGGFLSTSYTISYPDRVAHLILADPWGFSDHLDEKPPYWSCLAFTMIHVRGLEIVRAIGPFGPWLIQKMRSDISLKFEDILEDKTVILNYIYHCNAQYPTGERAFGAMLWGYAWAKNPMIRRIDTLRSDISISLLYGSETWMDKSMGQKVKDSRPDSYVDVQIIDDTGHHLYSEQADIFNEIISKACEEKDSKIASGNEFIKYDPVSIKSVNEENVELTSKKQQDSTKKNNINQNIAQFACIVEGVHENVHSEPLIEGMEANLN